MQAIILASSSHYRAELLRRLGLPVECSAANVDESTIAGESGQQSATRLALAKAEKIARQRSAGLVIGSDQVPVCQNDLSNSIDMTGSKLGKPGNRESARKQLQFISGRVVHFHTAVHIIDAASLRSFSACDKTSVRVRVLEKQEIERYLHKEPAFDCAGSFKVEALGISLFESVQSDDPTALIGLPLISVCKGLREFGVAIP